MPSISSDFERVNFLVSAASRWAYASAPTAVAWKAPDPATTMEPESTWSPVLLSTASDFAGEQRLVDLQPVALEHGAVGQDLVPGLQPQHVVEHHVADGDLRDGTVPHDPGGRGVQHREAVERPLGPHLLHDADERVPDDHETEQRVGGGADGEDGDEERAEDGVEAGEDVAADDGGERPARLLVDPVDLPRRDPLGDLGGRQARGRGRDGRHRTHEEVRVPVHRLLAGLVPGGVARAAGVR